MDRQQIGVKLTMDSLALPFKTDGFENRLILQKAIYLAQAAGVNLGYYYHWYLYGPYCPALTRDAYTIANELDQDMDESYGWTLDRESQSRLKRLQNLINKGEREKMARRLELLASVHFLIDRRQVSTVDISCIAATLERFNKDFSEKDVERALGELKTHGLLQV